MDRRDFLRGAGGVVAGSALLGACGGTAGEAPAQAADAARHSGTARVAARSILDRPATACPIDHVVVLMMENRSFDHWLGWLADDQAWLDRGRKRYGRSFSIAGDQTRTFPDPVTGSPVSTAYLPELLAAGNPWRGCDHPDPGHSWTAGRAERDQGFCHVAPFGHTAFEGVVEFVHVTLNDRLLFFRERA